MECRIRDLSAPDGTALRLVAAPDRQNTRLWLGTPGADRAPVSLDRAGAAMLVGFLLAARLSVPQGLPDERQGNVDFTLLLRPAPMIRLRQPDAALGIGEALWDRLYAELLLALAWADGAAAGLATHHAAEAFAARSFGFAALGAEADAIH